jgi:hypothetical protein
MSLVHVKTFTAQRTGKCIREVDCEKCATPFSYELTRIGLEADRRFMALGLKKRACVRRSGQA